MAAPAPFPAVGLQLEPGSLGGGDPAPFPFLSSLLASLPSSGGGAPAPFSMLSSLLESSGYGISLESVEIFIEVADGFSSYEEVLEPADVLLEVDDLTATTVMPLEAASIYILGQDITFLGEEPGGGFPTPRKRRIRYKGL